MSNYFQMMIIISQISNIDDYNRLFTPTIIIKTATCSKSENIA